VAAVTYYKATRPDGTDFHTGKIKYEAGKTVTHPCKRKVRDDPSTYLSVSIAPADCTGFSWPCRLFRVKPVGRTIKATSQPNKRGCSALRVVGELPAHMALGPNGEAVAAFIERCRGMTGDEANRLYAARGAALDAAFDAAKGAARGAAFDAAKGAAIGAARCAAWGAARCAVWDTDWYAALDAVGGIVVRDLITPEQHDILVEPLVDAGLGEWVK